MPLLHQNGIAAAHHAAGLHHCVDADVGVVVLGGGLEDAGVAREVVLGDGGDVAADRGHHHLDPHVVADRDRLAGPVVLREASDVRWRLHHEVRAEAARLEA